MARTKNPHRCRFPSPLFVTFRRIAFPILNLCTVPTNTLDKIVELCAGTNAMIRIERARNTKLINKLSKTLDLEHVGDGTWVDVVDCRFTGNSEATVSSVVPWKDPYFGVVYPAPGSGSLCGLLFSNLPVSRPSSSSSQTSSQTSDSEVSIIEDHSAGRTNLANRYKSLKVEPYDGHSSCLGAFPSNPKTSRIAAQLAYERQEPEDDGGEWIDETDNTKVKNKTTRVRASALGREIRNGRRTIKFLGGGVSKEKGDPSKDIKQIGQNETREGLVENDCAIESCDDEECDSSQLIIEQQKLRKRYRD